MYFYSQTIPKFKMVTTRKQRKEKDNADEKDNGTPDESKQEMKSQETSSPIITDWSKESKTIEQEENSEDEHQKSVLEFDRKEYKDLDQKNTLQLTNDQMIKILICRGEEQCNPTIFRGLGNILQQIHGERTRKSRKTFNFRGHKTFPPNSRRDGRDDRKQQRYEDNGYVKSEKYERNERNERNERYGNDRFDNTDKFDGRYMKKYEKRFERRNDESVQFKGK